MKVKGQGSERRGNIYSFLLRRMKEFLFSEAVRRQGEERHDNIVAATASTNAIVDVTSVHVPITHW